MRNNYHLYNQIFMTDRKVFGHLYSFHRTLSHESILLKEIFLELLHCRF